MYVPSHFGAAEAQVTELLVGSPVADLVTATASGGLLATFLPVLYQPEAGERGSIIGHVARGNEQWRTPVSGEALIILHGPNA
jgi:transcriptional regulator